jgi:hypothetical protein
MVWIGRFRAVAHRKSSREPFRRAFVRLSTGTYPQSVRRSGISASNARKVVDAGPCPQPWPSLIFVSARRGHGNRLTGPGACSQTGESRKERSRRTRSAAVQEARPPAAGPSNTEVPSGLCLPATRARVLAPGSWRPGRPPHSARGSFRYYASASRMYLNRSRAETMPVA